MQSDASFLSRAIVFLRLLTLLIMLSTALMPVTAHSETISPVTTPTPIMGTYGTAQSVTLSCSDGAGSGCAATYYCQGSGCTPTNLYSGPVSIATTTTLSFYSTDLDGNSEQVRTYAYTIDPSLVFRFERLWPQLQQPWYFNNASGVAVDTSGNVYVADTDNNRIQKFDASGTFVTGWGTYGSGNGQFKNPGGLSVDSSGNVYVADTGNHRIQKFSSAGVFVTVWGAYGNGNSQFYAPYALALDSSGNVYVADTMNNRIKKFTGSGSFLTSWGATGSGTGQFNYPYGIAADSSGYVYVADYNNNRIQKFDANGTFMTAWGSLGSGDGQFYYPKGISVDTSGNVYVTEGTRIQKFSPNGDFLTKWASWGSGNGQLSSAFGLAVDLTGYVYVADTYNKRIQKFSPDGVFVNFWGASSSSNGQFKTPQGITLDSTGNIYVADSYNNRIQKFDATGAFVAAWGSSGTGNGQFSTPKGVAVDAGGNVFVADYGNNRVQKFTSGGSFVTVIGSSGSGNGQFSQPFGLTIDSAGNLYVADTYNNRIQKFDASGAFVTTWGSAGSGNGQFSHPHGITVNGSGNVYVADIGNNRIQKFDANGSFVSAWGSTGSGNGQFSSVIGIKADANGNLFVADSNNHRIQKFTSSGIFTTSWGSFGSGNGQLNVPQGVTVDSAGNVYVADTSNNRIQKFDPVPQTPPGAPTGVTVTAGNGQATVTFTAPAANGGSPITSYTVTSNPGDITAAGSASPITVSGLSNGTAYTFTVTATNTNGTGAASSASTSVTPHVTYSLVLTVSGSGTVHSTPAPDINCSGSCGQSYDSGTDVTLTASPGNNYFFSGWSGACSGSGSCTVTMSQARSVAATFTSALPGAPTGVTATAGNGQATVSFTAPVSNGGSPITSYTVTSNPGNITASGTASTITVTGLVNGTSYRFIVAATNANGTGAPSTLSNYVTPLLPTYFLTLSVSGSGTVHSIPEPDISCSGTCGLPYSSGTVVSLTATPGSGYVFSGWSGYCIGTGSCIVSMSQARDVAAYFSSSGFSNGACGSAHNSQSVDTPVTNLCLSGTPSAVTGIGPWNWTCAGSDGGSTASCSATQAGGAFYRSSDGGATWAGRATGSGFNSPINVLAVSPCYNLADLAVFLGAGDGTYKSLDSGDSWTKVLSGTSVQALALSPDFCMDGTLFSGLMLDGIQKSTDGGTTWNTVNIGLPGTQIRALAISPGFLGDQTIFSGILGQGVYKSTNGGTTWVAANAGIDTISPLSLAISSNFAADRTIFAATTDGQYGGGGPHYHIYKSTDGGDSWVQADSGLSGAITKLELSEQFSTDHTLFAVTSSGIYKSIDSGNAWSRVNTATAGNSLALSKDYSYNQILFAGIYGDNVYASANGGATWTPSTSNFAAVRQLSALAISPVYYFDSTVFAAAYFTGPRLSVSPGSLSYGNVTTGTPSTSKQVTITNGQFGDANLAISSITLSGTGASQYSIAPGSCGTLAPVLVKGAQCSLDVTFTPTATGSASATLQINSNAVMSPTAAVNLSGTGIGVSSTISTPFINGNSVSLSGTASCSAGDTVALVEVSIDGGITWQPASGTTSWSKSLTLPDGSYPIKSRATTSTGIVETPGFAIIANVPGTIDTQAPIGTLALYNGVWTLNANSRDGQMCLMIYPSICGTVEMSPNGVNGWQPATTTPGTSGPLWLRDRAGNVSAMIGGALSNDNGGPIRMEGGYSTYYSFLQHALNSAGSGTVLKLTAAQYSETLLANTNTTYTVRGGYDSSHGTVTGTTQLSGTLTVQAGTLTVENLDLTGTMTVAGGAVTASALSIQ